jgi:hypothetical protein
MDDQNINIRRPYFKKDKYGRIIDNNFQQLGDVFVTSSIGDFYSNYLSLLLSMTPEQHALFYSGSLPYSKFDTTNLSSSEVERLRALVSESRENKVLRNDNTSQEHPIIPNGSFYRQGEQVIFGNEIKLANGVFFYIQDGKARRCETPNVFLSLFQSVTNLNPYKKEVLEDNVPYIGVGGLPEGKIITLADLGSENYKDESDNTPVSSDCQEYSVSALFTTLTFEYLDCNRVRQQKTTSTSININAIPESIKFIRGNGLISPVIIIPTGSISIPPLSPSIITGSNNNPGNNLQDTIDTSKETETWVLGLEPPPTL